MTFSSTGRSCVTCGATLSGRFCAACGEKQLTPDDERLWTFLKEQVQEFLSADGKLWRTIKALFVPGKLTTEYLAGRRGLYVRPIRIFLFVNIVLFFAMRDSNGTILKGPLTSSFSALLYGSLAQRLAEARAAVWPGGMESFQGAFDAQSAALAPTLVAVLIPVLALVLMLNRRRRSGVRHVVLATHLVSWMIAATTIFGAALSIGLQFAHDRGWIQPGVDSIDPVLVPSLIVLYAIYFILAIRRVYGLSPWRSLASGVLCGTVGFAFAFWTFRAFLYFVTLWMLDRPAPL
jgi:hypothetical protein